MTGTLGFAAIVAILGGLAVLCVYFLARVGDPAPKPSVDRRDRAELDLDGLLVVGALAICVLWFVPRQLPASSSLVDVDPDEGVAEVEPEPEPDPKPEPEPKPDPDSDAERRFRSEYPPATVVQQTSTKQQLIGDIDVRLAININPAPLDGRRGTGRITPTPLVAEPEEPAPTQQWRCTKRYAKQAYPTRAVRLRGQQVEIVRPGMSEHTAHDDAWLDCESYLNLFPPDPIH